MTCRGKPRSPPSCVQAKDERAAANGGWRWALVHARGMVRDIGLVLRIRSFQILILQARLLLWQSAGYVYCFKSPSCMHACCSGETLYVSTN